jgi:hypothetical protein
MCTFKGRQLIRNLCYLALLGTPLWAEQAQTADQKLAAGVRIVNENCGDSQGGTTTGCDRGAAMVEEALREGAKDRRTGLMALVSVYSEYVFAYVRERPMSDAARSSWRKRLAEIYQELLHNEPRNVSLWLDYGDVVEDRKEKLRINEHVLQIQPDTAQAAFYVAYLHAEDGQARLAADEYVSALRLPSATAELIQNFLRGLTEALRANGKSQENAKYIEQVSAAAAEALKARAAKDK